MTPEQFCYWLQGFGELGGTPPTPEQWKSINEHLATVFKKVTPPVSVPKDQSELARKLGQARPAPSPFEIGRAIPFPNAPYPGGMPIATC